MADLLKLIGFVALLISWSFVSTALLARDHPAWAASAALAGLAVVSYSTGGPGRPYGVGLILLLVVFQTAAIFVVSSAHALRDAGLQSWASAVISALLTPVWFILLGWTSDWIRHRT